MGFQFRYFLFFAIIKCYATAYVENDAWPFYLKKCKPNTSDFDTCLTEHANTALLFLYEGAIFSGFPPLVPYTPLTTVPFGKNRSFKINISNVNVYGLNYINVLQLRWDIKKKHIFIKTQHTNSIQVTGTYISSGTFLKRRFNGHGITYLDFLDGNITFNIDYTTQKINSYEYATIAQCQATRAGEFPRFYFSQDDDSLQQSNNFNNYINEHNYELNTQLNDDMNEYLCIIANKIFRPLFYNFPIEIIFD